MQPLPALYEAFAPFNKAELEDVRMKIVKEMDDNGFQTYLTAIEKIVDKINTAFDDEKCVLDDNYFASEMSGVWWQQTSNWLTKKYEYFKAGPVTLTQNPFVARIVSKAVHKFIIKRLIVGSATMPTQQVMLFRTIIGTYFRNHVKLWPIMLNVDYTMKLKIDEGKGGPMDLLTSIVSGAGPFVLKLLQQINSSANDGEGKKSLLAKVTNSVLSDVPPLLRSEVEYMAQRLKITPEVRENMSLEPLSSGSLAQSHCSHYNNEPSDVKDLNRTNKVCGEHDYPVIVKILKPVYVYYFLCEINFLLVETWKSLRGTTKDEPNPDRTLLQTRQLLMFLVREFSKEFRYDTEADNTLKGYDIYNKPSSGLRSARLCEVDIEKFPVLVVEVASTVPLDRVFTQISEANLGVSVRVKTMWKNLRQAVGNLIVAWMENLFWGTGFFHADLHAGNIMIQPLEVLLRGEQPVLWIIDYGSAGTLTNRLKCKLLDAMFTLRKLKQFEQYVKPISNDDIQKEIHLAKDDKIQPRNLARFYHKFSLMTTYQKEQLNHLMSVEWAPEDQEMPEMWSDHLANVRMAEAFVRILWDVCEISNYRTYDDMKTLAEKILNYNRYLDFGSLFLDFILRSNDIGKCTSNPVLLFGRGISYLNDIMRLTSNLCNDNAICPFWMIDKDLQWAVIFKGKKQLLNIAWGTSVCQDE